MLGICLQALLVPRVILDHLESKVPQDLQEALVRLGQLEQPVLLEALETEDLLGCLGQMAKLVTRHPNHNHNHNHSHNHNHNQKVIRILL